MGNAIAKSYDVPKDYNATAGHCSLYKIWHGKKKGSSEDVSVWTFDKSDLSKRKSPVNDKAVQEQVLQLMRKDITCLKECNCEGIIQIIEVFTVESLELTSVKYLMRLFIVHIMGYLQGWALLTHKHRY
jgi:hypothetical protein